VHAHRANWVWPAVAALWLAACGGGGGGGDPPVDSTPSISQLSFAPLSVLQYDGNGTQWVTGTLHFRDAGKDLALLHLVSTDGSSLSSTIDGVAGVDSGTLMGSLQVDTSVIGSFAFSIQVSDSGGRRSNLLQSTFTVLPNDTGSRWTPRTLGTLPGTPHWQRRVRWSGTLFVTVGDGIHTSPDGVTWTERTAGVPARLNDVTWTGSGFVAVGDGGAIVTSTDGQAWTPRSMPVVNQPALYGVAASPTRLVAVGTQWDNGISDIAGLIITSGDGGASWQAVPGLRRAALYAVIWADGQFVAVGSTLDRSTAQATAFTSTDGLAWTQRNLDTLVMTTLQDVAWGGGRYVAVGYGGAATSTDGISWQPTGSGQMVSDTVIAWSGQRFLTCGTIYCLSSTDGLQWQGGAPLPGLGSTAYGLAWNGSRWVAVGSQSFAATSP